MSIGKRNKDHRQAEVHVPTIHALVAPRTNDPLRFWTNHPTDNFPVNLHPFADGELQNPNAKGAGTWGGPFSGRPTLTHELAPVIEAHCALISSGAAKSVCGALRAWWRLLDRIEDTSRPGSQRIARVESVADLNQLHEAAAHRAGMSDRNFRHFLNVANSARRLKRMPVLMWVPPRPATPIRTLIPDDQARDLKTALKQEWEGVKRTWRRNDAIRLEADRRLSGAKPFTLSPEDEVLVENWLHFRRVQSETQCPSPSIEQLCGKLKSTASLHSRGLVPTTMRQLAFPTMNEANAAFHLALMNSGWNPSTMSNLDADSPRLLSDHPKAQDQIVLMASDDDNVVTIGADKPRARGRTQFCTALRKHSSSAPMIVVTYLGRVEALREMLKEQYASAIEELARMQAAGESAAAVENQFVLAQELRKGCTSVWLYLDRHNKVNWIDGMKPPKYVIGNGNVGVHSYLDRVLTRVNEVREREGLATIPPVTASDFRDIYARWVYRQTGGNILAVMLALGHSTLKSANAYVDNNILNAEQDERTEKFMSHVFAELGRGRVDLTILAELARSGSLKPELEAKLHGYRKLMRSQLGVGCADPYHPPIHIAPRHVEGRLCGRHRCLLQCTNAKFLPESLDGIAMRVEELLAMSDLLPRETWLTGDFEKELQEGESVLKELFAPAVVAQAREKWRARIANGRHIVPGLGPGNASH